MTNQQRLLLLGAIVLALLVRAPGILWGSNFPFGWYGHHPDEYTHWVQAELLINPTVPPTWTPHPYPKGMAAHVAVPMIAQRVLRGETFAPRPPRRAIVEAGRVVGVLYGALTAWAVFLLAGQLTRDSRLALLAAYLMALGGLHVSQSHFFVADVPAIFWLLLGLYFLLRDLEGDREEPRHAWFLIGASFSLGVAFGLKLMYFAIPSLVAAALLRPPRLFRFVNAGAYGGLGVVLVNFASYTPEDVYKTLLGGLTDPTYVFNPWPSLLLYAIELPSVVSLPVTVLALIGVVASIRAFVSPHFAARRLIHGLVVAVPVALSLVLLLRVSHFPRHLLALVPWICIAAAWTLRRAGDWLVERGLRPAWAIVPVFAYLALFVYDGERVYLDDPRNAAATWLQENAAGGSEVYWRYKVFLDDYAFVDFPATRPEILVVEMHDANHYLSGLGLRGSMPRDYTRIFDSPSQEWIDAHQALFTGDSEYTEVARFDEGYFMPEYRITDALIGNRSRNYVAPVVIFRRPPGRDTE